MLDRYQFFPTVHQDGGSFWGLWAREWRRAKRRVGAAQHSGSLVTGGRVGKVVSYAAPELVPVLVLARPNADEAVDEPVAYSRPRQCTGDQAERANPAGAGDLNHAKRIVDHAHQRHQEIPTKRIKGVSEMPVHRRDRVLNAQL